MAWQNMARARFNLYLLIALFLQMMGSGYESTAATKPSGQRRIGNMTLLVFLHVEVAEGRTFGPGMQRIPRLIVASLDEIVSS
mmetsp:Transcript_2818/g.6527  ORF Transcript_2818/g.6527 Transcript_2818/m.6527 type:complete len:83 (+) Transcript_2818:941-1189(+)